MRLSLLKAGHAAMAGAAQQEIRVLRVFCEGWDSTALHLESWPSKLSIVANFRRN